MITISFTYDMVTHESAEYGDNADNGFYDRGHRYSMNVKETYDDIMKNPSDYHEVWQPGKLRDALREAINLGIYQPSEGNSVAQIGENAWFSSVDADQDFATGESTYYSLHVSGTTSSTKRRIARLLSGKQVFGR
jgi:hypothetical protein